MRNNCSNDKANTKLEASTKALYISVYGRKKLGTYKFIKKTIPNYEHNVLVAGRIRSIKIEVRNTEKPHNLAHFHVIAPEKINAVYTIDPIAYYEGEIDSKSSKAVLAWAEINRGKKYQNYRNTYGR